MKSICVLLLMAMGVVGVQGGTNGFVIPAIRGTHGASFAGWEIFKFGKETNNFPDLASSSRDARLAQFETNGFVTGSGNIYNVSQVSRFRVSYASRFPINQVILQARTLGAELNYNSVQIHFDEAGERKILGTTRAELDRGTAQGVNVSSKWEWDLTGRDVTVFNIEFIAAGASLSFDSATLDVSTEVIRLTGVRVDMDRWMYPFNATPGTRGSASVFAAFGEDSGVDTRDAQFLLGWNLTNQIPSGKGAANYVVREGKVSLTINRDLVWAYDGTLDDWKTYLTTNDTRRVEDSDPGRPVELFGAGFRGDYTAQTFPEAGPFGGDGGGIEVRNAYAAGFNAANQLIDVSNNVGKNDTNAFEAIPFAVGSAQGLEAGTLVPSGTTLTFDLPASNANVASYLAEGLDGGALRLIATSLIGGSFNEPNYPQFATRDNTLATQAEMPSLDLVVQIAKSSPDLQASPGAAGKVRFSWPQTSERYELERGGFTIENLNWLSPAGAATVESGVATIEIDAAEAAGFFRLHRVL